MKTPRILVVEDEEAFVDVLTLGLSKEGFEVVVARDGAEALARFDADNPDVILLDLMLPRISGIDVCREIRRRSKVPIIMVTAKSSEVDTVVGLEVGADDYITKPYRMRELIARVRAVLRRVDDAVVAGPVESSTVQVGDISVDPDSHEVIVRGVHVPIALKEFDLLLLLMENAGRVLSRETLIDRVWGHDYVGDTKTLDVHVKRIRAKVEDDPSNPTRIVTIRGLGYKYEKPRA